MCSTLPFADRPADKTELEQGTDFAPKFDEHGLIPCIAQQAETGEVLMFAFMNELSLAKTIETGQVHYWSRSRNQLWFKGESSGMTHNVVQLLTDCDQDAIVARVTIGQSTSGGGVQASCHVGYRNCFYRAIETGQPTDRPAKMSIVGDQVYDPNEVYGSF